MGTELGITPVIIRGEELKQRGFGGTVSGDVSLGLSLAYIMTILRPNNLVTVITFLLNDFAVENANSHLKQKRRVH